MRKAATFVAIAALLATPAVALAQEEFTADLTIEQEVPAPTVPGDYAGTGSATVTISADETEIAYDVTFDGLTGPLTMAHIHWQEPGQAGPPIFWLTEMGVSDTPSPLTGTLTEADFMAAEGGPQSFAEALEAMRAGNTYVNLHTEQNPPGELRGQLTAADEPDPGEEPAASPPDTSTADVAPASGAPWLVLLTLLVLALAAFFAVRTRLGRMA